MQNPPLVAGGERRPLSDHCDVIIHDVEDGVVLVIENRDKIAYTLRFDFGKSENLTLNVPSDVERVDHVKCNMVAEGGTSRNLCHLTITDESVGTLGLRYLVQCLVRNAKGELEEVKKPAPKSGGAPSRESRDERKQITETLFLIISESSDGYILTFESTDKDDYIIKLDLTSCENLKMETGPRVTADGEMKCSLTLQGESKLPACRCLIADSSKGGCSLSYKLMQRKDSSAREARERDEAAKKKADDDAAARKKAEDDAARKKAEDDAAKKRADDEAARKKAEDDAAQKKAEAEAAARKKAEDDAARKKAEEAERLKQAELAKAKYAALLIELEKQEYELRMKIELESRQRWILIEKSWRESMCNLCRQPFKTNEAIKEYKIYKLHQPCYDAAPKCSQCNDVLIGQYVIARGDLNDGIKLHNECIDAYKNRSRPDCTKCGQKILENTWSTVGTAQYHTACKP